MTSIRGAVTAGENTAGAIMEAAKKLIIKVIEANGLDTDQIIDIIFSATKDLNAAYPAAAARELGITNAGLFCVQEMDVQGSLPMCIRALFHVDAIGKKQSDMRHIYLGDAKKLRPDLAKIAVAIDGPAGAGKSTVAKEVAKAAGIIYVDTGAMYRAVALYNIRKGADLTDCFAVEKSLDNISIDINYDSDKQQRLLLNGEDVTEALRTGQAAEGSSVVAVHKAVRQKLVKLQQALASKHSVVMDGRDIGTFVLPDADLKIYLDASLEERIRRRMGELKKNGQSADYETVKSEMETRDYRDINREFAPLIRADDAIYIKSDGISVQDITKKIIEEMGKRCF